jgi:hypothetical protein
VVLKSAGREAVRIRAPPPAPISLNLTIKAAQAQIRWVDTLMDTHREMCRLAGVRVWQEAIMAAMREAGQEALTKFPDYLREHGHLSMVSLQSSGFARRQEGQDSEPR